MTKQESAPSPDWAQARERWWRVLARVHHTDDCALLAACLAYDEGRGRRRNEPNENECDCGLTATRADLPRALDEIDRLRGELVDARRPIDEVAKKRGEYNGDHIDAEDMAESLEQANVALEREIDALRRSDRGLRDNIDRLMAERDDARDEIERLRQLYDDEVTATRKAVDEIESNTERVGLARQRALTAADALAEYAQHRASCPARGVVRIGGMDWLTFGQPCTCGLEVRLSAYLEVRRGK